MSNSFLSPTVIAKEVLRILHNNLTFAKGVNRQYDSSFGNSGITVSGKAGPSLRVRKPNRYTVTDGAALVVQDNVEEYVTVSCTTQEHVGMKFSSADLTLTIDDFAERYLKPAALALAAKIDRDGLKLAAQTVYNSVGTPGTAPGSGMTAAQTSAIYLNAGAILDEYTTPRDNQRYMILNPAGQAATVSALGGLFQSASKIAEQYEAGEMGTSLGMTFKMDQQVYGITTGTGCAKVMDVKGANQTGSSLLCDATNSDVFKIGEVFTIAGVNSVNPESFQDTGRLQQFVVTADATAGSSEVTLSISPSIYATTTSAGKQTVTALPGNLAVITWYDTTASKTRPQNILNHKDAFTLVTADLVMPEGVDFKARQVHDGMSIRIVRQYNINGDELPCRLDVLYGWKELYPFYAARIWG
jgi:hypothetical protein